jgi:sulfate adenylyltransferase
LYARARSGEIPEFTGVSDPYEEPRDAQIVIDASVLSVDSAVDAVFAALD